MEMKTNNKIYFIYTRVSKIWEYDMSLEDQKNILLEMAKKNLHKTIIIEEMASWKKENRGEFDKMMTLIIEDSKLSKENRKYAWIYVFKLDRFARNSIDFTRWEKILDEWYKIISATETLENTPTWRLLFRMLSSFAIFESEKLSNRQSLSRIQNLMRWNIQSLWGKLIFWYKKENGKIEIDIEQARIINKIYDIYKKIEWKIKGEEEKYKEIWKQFSKDEKSVIRKHLLWNKTNNNINLDWIFGNDIRLIRNILNNNQESKNSLKYNWFFFNKLNINDELIVNYIKNIEWKEDNDFELDWINEVGSSIVLSFYFNNLQIVDDYKYNLNYWNKKNYNKKEEIIWKYSDLLYFYDKSWKQIEFEAYKQKSIQYRTKKRKVDNEKWLFISQLKIDKLLDKNKTLKKIVLNEKQINYLRELSIKQVKSIFQKKEKSLRIRKILYENFLNNCKYEISILESNDIDLLTKNKEMIQYNQVLEKTNKEIYNLNNYLNSQIEIFLNIFKNIKDTLKDTDSNINKKLKVFIDWIELDRDKKSEIYIKEVKLSLFIKELLWVID